MVRFVKYLTKISQFHNRKVHICNQAVIKYMQFLLNVQSKKSLMVGMKTTFSRRKYRDISPLR
ncbi:MAG TPA: hypothetical protein DHV72_21640 [Serratia grimesii]|uniref:Uncharacterized protein n=1 Tax=Serratia grimesii TaxID=82995 RepID=A0A9C7R0X7_9GAMM|nr:hypothetical protein [Serratia grimesii]